MKCDDSILQTLVDQSIDPGDEFQSIADHVETCVRCQQTLDNLGGDAAWWNEAHEWLSIPADQADFSVASYPSPSIDLSFLESPSHPEMLGRVGRYEVESVLGRGGMGVVLRAYDSDLHRSVAIKVLAPEWAASIPARQRFSREAQAAASVAHENVIPIYNVESDAPLPYLVMRYIPGMTLQRWVTVNGTPDVATILRVAGQLAEGLAAAHRRGLVHRDIKPGNVMVGENIERIWLTDFGLARAADSVTLTQTGIIAGTPSYMSPEQARGENLDQQSDLFSFGCLLYFLATEKPPFESDNTLAVLHRITSENAQPLATHRDDLPPAFTLLVQQLLNRQRHKRPSSCDEVIDALKTAQTQLDAGLTAKVPMTRTMRRALVSAGSIACLGAILSIAYWLTTASFTSQDDPGRVAPATVDVSPYISQAANQIEKAAWLDSRQLDRRIREMRAESDRLWQSEPTVAAPCLLLSDKQWQTKINALDNLIQQSQKR